MWSTSAKHASQRAQRASGTKLGAESLRDVEVLQAEPKSLGVLEAIDGNVREDAERQQLRPGMAALARQRQRLSR